MYLNVLDDFFSESRYKLYLLLVSDPKKFIETSEFRETKVIDVGKELSLRLNNYQNRKHLGLFVQEQLENLVKDNQNNSSTQTKYVFLSNFGILLEPDIAFNAERIIAEISKNTHIVLIWSGEYNNQNVLNWKTQQSHYNLDFSRYGLKTINLKNEI